MKAPERNAPCPCGSGKKFKKCCLKAERDRERVESLEADAIRDALVWLNENHEEAFDTAVSRRVGEMLGPEALEDLAKLEQDLLGNLQDNLHEWILAEGRLEVDGELRSCQELLTGPGGPLLDAVQRQYLEKVWARPLRLYIVVEVRFAEGIYAQDALAQEDAPPLWIHEPVGSQQLIVGSVFAARLIPGKTWKLSRAVYLFPSETYEPLRLELVAALSGGQDEAMKREIAGEVITTTWFDLLVEEEPLMIDPSSKEMVVFATDHYEVLDWDRLEKKLGIQEDVVGDRGEGWRRVEDDGEDLPNILLSIDAGEDGGVRCFVRTTEGMDEQRSWFESIAGDAVKYSKREFSKPFPMFLGPEYSEDGAEGIPFADFRPQLLTEAYGNLMEESYRDWAGEPIPVLENQTPKEAVKTPKGLEAVVELLRSYELAEVEQAKSQSREPASMEFLWKSVGLDREQHTS